MKIISSLSILLFVFGSHNSLAEDCGEPRVVLGEVMAGLQAGLTGGAHTMTGQPEAFFGAVGLEDRRGFIIPENELPSTQCDNDYILIGEWFACSIGTGVANRKPKEAKDCVNAGLNGLVVDYFFEVDGNTVEHMQTGTKIGFLPDNFGGNRVAFFTAGHIIEPFSLAPGPHTATAVFQLDLDCISPVFQCDGVADFDFTPTADFTIIDSAAP